MTLIGLQYLVFSYPSSMYKLSMTFTYINRKHQVSSRTSVLNSKYLFKKNFMFRSNILGYKLGRLVFKSSHLYSKNSKSTQLAIITSRNLNRCIPTMTDEVEKYFQGAFELTKSAGKLLQEKVYMKKTIELKSGNIDFVTETDQEIEKFLISGLTKQFPDHKFIGEETVSSGGKCELTNAPTWIIDPIDGTMNFVHSFPHSCISVGLFVDCEPQAAIIYNPLLDQMFTAIKSKGAFLNGKRIHVSEETSMANALVMLETGTSRDPERFQVLLENLKMLIPQVHGIRSLGSAALNMAMVALGGADAYFEFGIHIWDIAAGELIITEAGGVVVDPCGGPIDRLSRRILCTSTQQLANELSQKLAQFYPTPTD